MVSAMFLQRPKMDKQITGYKEGFFVVFEKGCFMFAIQTEWFQSFHVTLGKKIQLSEQVYFPKLSNYYFR